MEEITITIVNISWAISSVGECIEGLKSRIVSAAIKGKMISA